MDDDFLAFEATAISRNDVRLDPRTVATFCWPMQAIVLYLRAHVAFVRSSNAYLFKAFDPDTGRYRHELRTHREMTNILSKHRFPMPQDSRGLTVKDYKGSEFLDSGYILMYESVVFLPLVPGATILQYPGGGFRVFNMFGGFRFTRDTALVTEVRTGPFLSHAKHILCNNNDDLFNYFMTWLAHLVQHPATKPGTALLLVSSPGAGKNVFFDIFRDVIGCVHYMLVNNTDRVLSRFNAHLATKLLVVMDEATFDKSHEGAAVMKSLITQTDTVLEKKFTDAMTVKSYERYVLLSNDENPIKIDRGDRRYCCLDVSDERVGNHAYFDWFTACYRDTDSLRAVYSMLSFWPNVPVVLPPPPTTSLKQDIIENSASLECKFATALKTQPTHFLNISPGDRITPAHALSLYKDWLGENGYESNRANAVRLGSTLSRILGPKSKVKGDSVTLRGGKGLAWENAYTV